MKFVLIPAGEFDMGSPTDEEGHHENEEPVQEGMESYHESESFEIQS